MGPRPIRTNTTRNGGTMILLHIYDLSPANDYLYPIGLAIHHSGVEILGVEYSFASGAGIFESPTPKYAPGAKFRESIELGTFPGGSAEVRDAISDLRNDFAPHAYHLIFKNCNHFANALVYRLLQREIPPHVNRLANVGSFFSCLLPKKMLETAPVGDTGTATTSSLSGGMKKQQLVHSSERVKVFSGSGYSLGSSASSNTTSKMVGGGIFGSKSNTSNNSNSKVDDSLTDRREKARKAAMMRWETTQRGAS